MKNYLCTPEGIFIIAVVILLIIVGIVFIFWPKKKLCKKCGQHTTRNKNSICDDCCYEHLLQKARKKSQALQCPYHHNIPMTMSILIDIGDVGVYECTDPACDYIALHKSDLQKITLLELDFYPQKKINPTN